MERQLNFKIKEGIKPVDELDDNSEEWDERPGSYGFWSSLGDGDGNMFIDLLEDEETRKACHDAVRVLSKLENAVDDYIVWM